MKLNLCNSHGFNAHRAGWGYCIEHLSRYHSSSGIYVDDFIEKTFSWDLCEYYYGKNRNKIPYRFPWVGFLHNPPNSPEWFHNVNKPQSIFKRAPFIESLEYCKCIITLSDYLKKWVEKNIPVKVPVVSVKHPTLVPDNKWSYKKFIVNKNKSLVQIGYWLRNFDSICHAIVPNDYIKTWLPSNPEACNDLTKIYESIGEKAPAEVKNKWANTSILNRLTDKDYDEYLSHNIGYANIYDASANNAVVECVARNTPLITNRIPSTVEYLGPDYPLYCGQNPYDTFPLLNKKRILEGHEYLRDMNKDWVHGEFFALDLIKKLKEVI